MSQGHDHRGKHDGIRAIRRDELDPTAAQTPGMFRQVAIDHARVGAQKLWAGTVRIEPNAKTGVHHHGALESVLLRSDNEAVVVNITDVEPAERPEAVYWVDPIHRHP